MKTSNAYEITIARNLEQVEQLRHSWARMQWHPNADIDLFSTLITARKSILRPHVMCLSFNGTAKTIFVCRIEETYINCKFGYKTIFKIKVKAINISYGGILGDTSRECCMLLISEIMKSLSHGEADIAFFNNLQIDSETFSIAAKTPSFLFRDHLTIPNLHWRMLAPKNMEDFYNSIDYKFRKNLRRTTRHLAKIYPSKIVVQRFRKVDEVNTFMNHAESIAEKTYQRSLNVGFKDNSQTRQLILLAAQRDCFRGYILYIDDRPVSFERTTKYGKTLFCEDAAYDPAYKDGEPGTNLFLKLLEDVCNEKEIENIDFGFGDALYKKNFCDQVLQEKSVYIFAPTLKGLLINITRTGINAISHFAVITASKMKLTQKIKKYWRNHITE
jgi:CelD/BcsL family acetyltransferase involved in cellulose biosynthesis